MKRSILVATLFFTSLSLNTYAMSILPYNTRAQVESTAQKLNIDLSEFQTCESLTKLHRQLAEKELELKNNQPSESSNIGMRLQNVEPSEVRRLISYVSSRLHDLGCNKVTVPGRNGGGVRKPKGRLIGPGGLRRQVGQ